MIFLIEEMVLDPSENAGYQAITFKVLGYITSEEKAIEYREIQWDQKTLKSYPLCYYYGNIGKYRVTELQELRGA